jgi:hypothetical protein
VHHPSANLFHPLSAQPARSASDAHRSPKPNDIWSGAEHQFQLVDVQPSRYGGEEMGLAGVL